MTDSQRFMTIRETGCTRTAGLEQLGQADIEFHYANEDLASAARRMAEEIIHYVETTGARVTAGQTIGWATSVIRFDSHGKRLRASALDLGSDDFVIALDELIEAWTEQRATCEASNSEYVPTQLIEMAVVSLGILEGDPIREAIRYPVQKKVSGWQSSGWWLIGAAYLGDIPNMKTIHVGDLLIARPNVRRYLALEPGFCFSEQLQPSVWYERDVAEQKPV